MGRALAEVIEAAHDTSPPDDGWLSRLTAAMHAHVGLPMLRAAVGYAWERHGSSYRATLTVASGDPTALTWTAAHDIIPRAWLRAMYGSGPIAIFVSDVATQRSAAIPHSLRDVWRRGGGDDPFGMVAPLDRDRGFAISVLPERPVHRLGSGVLRQIRQRWSSIAALVASGARVRRALRSGSIAAELDAVGHGEVTERARASRADLQHAAATIERTLTSPEGAMPCWEDVASGSWSVVRVSSGYGRVRYLAIENPPAGAPLRALTPHERRVVSLVARGASNKAIGFELGVHPAAVTNQLKTIGRKVGVTNRIQLARFANALSFDGAET